MPSTWSWFMFGVSHGHIPVQNNLQPIYLYSIRTRHLSVLIIPNSQYVVAFALQHMEPIPRTPQKDDIRTKPSQRNREHLKTAEI